MSALGIIDSMELISLDPKNVDSVRKSIQIVRPDHIYYLSGPSSVALSWKLPLETITEIIEGPHNFLETIRVLDRDIRFFHASSSECFGDQTGTLLNESSRFAPASPYAIGKATGHWAAVSYRNNFGMFVANGILSNHESVLRSEPFVIRKIIDYLKDVALEPKPPLQLGDTSVIRDWLWAGDVAQAIFQIMISPKPDDFIVASGESNSLKTLIEVGARVLNVGQETIYQESRAHYRYGEIPSVRLSPTKIRSELGWNPTIDFESLVKLLVESS